MFDCQWFSCSKWLHRIGTFFNSIMWMHLFTRLNWLWINFKWTFDENYLFGLDGLSSAVQCLLSKQQTTTYLAQRLESTIGEPANYSQKFVCDSSRISTLLVDFFGERFVWRRDMVKRIGTFVNAVVVLDGTGLDYSNRYQPMHWGSVAQC